MLNDILLEGKMDRETLLARAEEIGKLAEAESFESDKNGFLSDKVCQAMKEAEFHKLLKPKRYGGYKSIHVGEGPDDYSFKHELMSEISLFLKDRKINALMGEKHGCIVILFSECLLLKTQTNKKSFCQSLLNYCFKRYPQYQLYAGISSSSELLEETSQLYDECLSAIKVANNKRNLVFFDSLGIEGVMYHMKNVKPIEKFIKKKLGNLIEEDQSKDMELTRTLYCYLNNGCNVHKTARAMNFSISGLRYRLKKVNEILETDINIPSVGYQIFLALQFFIYWGEIDLEIAVDMNIDEE